MKRVAILQSNYIPWKGYFDIIHDVDEFVFHDDLQYTKQDWRNRNRIKLRRGSAWLTIPVRSNANLRICDIELPQDGWGTNHWRRLEGAYGKTRYFETYRPSLSAIYCEMSWRFLSDLNQHLIRTIAGDFLGIRTRFRDSREWSLESRRQAKVLDLLRKVDADLYVSGPAGASYLDPALFASAGIELVWKDYAGYPEYSQIHPPFDHFVTILDLLFHVGPDAPYYIWGWRGAPG